MSCPCGQVREGVRVPGPCLDSCCQVRDSRSVPPGPGRQVLAARSLGGREEARNVPRRQVYAARSVRASGDVPQGTCLWRCAPGTCLWGVREGARNVGSVPSGLCRQVCHCLRVRASGVMSPGHAFGTCLWDVPPRRASGYVPPATCLLDVPPGDVSPGDMPPGVYS